MIRTISKINSLNIGIGIFRMDRIFSTKTLEYQKAFLASEIVRMIAIQPPRKIKEESLRDSILKMIAASDT